MSGLSAFLAANVVAVENVKFAASERVLDDLGQPVLWEVACLSSAEEEDLRISCKQRVPHPEKAGQYMTEIDDIKFMGMLAARSTVVPNLDDAELQNSYGVMGAEALLKAMLTPGEYLAYVERVQEVNGFKTSFREDVEEAKKS